MGRSQLPGWSGESDDEDPNWPDPIAQKRIKQLAAFFAVLFLILMVGVIRAYA